MALRVERQYNSQLDNMLSSLLSLLLLLISFSPVATSFVNHQSSLSRSAFVLLSESNKKTATTLAMSTETSALPEIEVVSQPDKAFLENKGVCESSETKCCERFLASPSLYKEVGSRHP
jgi:hypothetical protein